MQLLQGGVEMFRSIQIFILPYAYGLPICIQAAHTGITGNPCLAHMRMSAHTRMGKGLPNLVSSSPSTTDLVHMYC